MLDLENEDNLLHFLINLNDEYDAIKIQILATEPLLPLNKAYYLRKISTKALESSAFMAGSQGGSGPQGPRVDGKRRSGGEEKHRHVCNMSGHSAEACFEVIGYPNWYKGKKNKKGGKMDANVMQDQAVSDTPLGMEENAQSNKQGSLDPSSLEFVKTMYHEMMQMFKGKGVDPSSSVNFAGKRVDQCRDVGLSSAMIIRNVLLVPGFQFNMMSVIRVIKEQKVLAQRQQNEGLYWLEIQRNQVQEAQEFCLVAQSSNDARVLHNRLGHISFSKMLHVHGFKNATIKSTFCDTCNRAKFHRLSFRSSNSKSLNTFDLLHMDLWGPFGVPNIRGERYFFTIVDDMSRATWTYLLHKKEQVMKVVKSFVAMFGKTPKMVRFDNGSELMNMECREYFSALGVIHQRTMTYTPQQNGIVERKHRHLLDTTRALSLHANLPKEL
ncbi:LOW QUALITY PROTEIN: hypothetical protein V2J09_010820 [Rumex salicifolius]